MTEDTAEKQSAVEPAKSEVIQGSEMVPGFDRELHKLPTNKIAILGTCPSRMQAPLNDLSWDLWTIGPGGKNSNRWSTLFEIHGQGTWPEGFKQYLQELKEVKPPKRIFTEEAMSEWPANVVYPRLQYFSKYGKKWFTSSISFALAQALEENVTDLGLWGIDLESGEEYKSQFDGCRYFLDLARLAGVNIHLPQGCGLLRDPMPYPDAFETHLAMTLQAKIDYLGEMASQLRAQHGEISAKINHIDGELAAFHFIRERYVIHGEDASRRLPVTQEKTLSQKIDMLMALMDK